MLLDLFSERQLEHVVIYNNQWYDLTFVCLSVYVSVLLHSERTVANNICCNCHKVTLHCSICLVEDT